MSNTNFRIEDLFFTKVKADTYAQSDILTYYTTAQNNEAYPTLDDYTQYFTTSYSPTGTLSQTFYFSSYNAQNFDYIYFPFVIAGNKNQVSTYNYTIYNGNEYCNRYHWTESSSLDYFVCDRVSSDSYNSNISEHVVQEVNITLYARLLRTDGGMLSCQVDLSRNVIICPMTHNYSYYGLELIYTKNFNTSTNINFGLGKLINTYYSDGNNITNSITNQTQQQQQQHEELMDDNTTQAEDDATSFFEDFTVPDVGGLSAIITAPLNTIQSLLNSTCTPLVLPLPFVNENLTLPCLTTIYTQHFGAFFTLYQTIILAIVAYRCIRSIFFDIHGFTDPSDDRIEVMDL